MRIYLDLDTRRILATAFRPATSLDFKRRDNDAFEVQFLRTGAVQALPEGATARVGLKATDDFAGGFLASDTLTPSGTNDDTIYAGELNLNTAAIETLFAEEPASISAMLEVEWKIGTLVGSSLTLPITIFNDVIRGDEGEPAELPLFYTSSTSNFLATQAEAEAGADNTKWMTPLRVAQAIGELSGGGGGPHTHPLTDLQQSSATSGQVVTWSGTAWVPQTPSGGGVTSYNDLTDVPSTFAPEVHTHAIADVTALQAALDGKAASTHTHAISDTTGLQTALDGKQATGSYAPATGIAQSAVTNLTTDLAGKASSSHTHAATDITSGTLAIARIPTGTTSSTTALGNHTHGNITNAGAIGTTATLPIITGTSGVLQAGSFGTTAGTFAQGNHTHTFGTTAGTFCQGNDSRLLTITGGITAIAVVATMPVTPVATTLYIVTG
jgi:hypothetical protein